MNIVIFGAGAIGSLFGALLANNNRVVLVGRSAHINTIQRKGLTITGKTNCSVQLMAVESIKDVPFAIDLILLTVKSYDTQSACREIRSYLNDKTMVMSLQNGLDNVETIERYIHREHILAGTTTQGVFFPKPGEIIHTGVGVTTLGELNGQPSQRLKNLANIFNNAGINTIMSTKIIKEIWIKGIINSSINPLTAFLGCKNGYLLTNPLLERIVEYVCVESTSIASTEGIILHSKDMIQKTKEVIRDTADNYSSMLQSIQQGKKTEIDSINGKLTKIGKKNKNDAPLNTLLIELVSSLRLN
jgi:2-dehydropantoate 2-reductase